jgi:hypothetical protein
LGQEDGAVTQKDQSFRRTLVESMNMIVAISQSPPALVGLSAFLATFIASVMADEQNDRLRQGTFGAIAGTSVGGLAAVIQKEPNLLLIGVFGSAVGAVVGWVVYLGLSILASRKWARRLIEYHVSGLKGVRDRIEIDDKNLLLNALNVWSQNYRGMVLRETTFIVGRVDSADYDNWTTIAIRGWLTSLIDAFNLVLDALAEKPEYRSRASVIVFGKKSNKVVGRHWISYSGDRQVHKKDDFGPDSIAYEVLSNSRNSPCFITMQAASQQGEDRGNPTYTSFLVFRLSDCAVLSLDWPGKIEERDPYVNVARGLLHLDVGPAIGNLLKPRKNPVTKDVDLDPL